MTTLRAGLRSSSVLLVLALPRVHGIALLAQESDPNQIHNDASFENLQRQAAAEADAGKNAEAMRDIGLALAIRPDWKEGWWNLGTMQYDSNQYQQAAQAFRRVVEFAPEMGPAWALMGLCEFELKDYANALSHLQTAQSRGFGEDPEIARVSSYHLALLLVRQGDFERGGKLLNSAFGQGPLSPQVKMALGLVLLRVPLLPEELDPSKDALVRAAGEVASGETASVTRFPELILSNPKTPYLHYAYGILLAKGEHLKEALLQQQEETGISPQSALPWIQISDLQSKLHNQAQAFSAAEKAVTLDPALPAAHESLAAALEALGKNERAQKEREHSQSLAPVAEARDPQMISLYGNPSGSNEQKQPDAETDADRWNQAMMDYSTGRYANAIAELKHLLQQNPSDGTGWAVLGLSEYHLSDYENARIHLERGEQFGLSGSADSVRLAKYTLAILLVRGGEFGHASEILASAAGPGNLQLEIRFASGLALLHISKLPEEVQPAQRDLAEHAGEIAELLHESKYDQADAEFEALLKQYPSTPFLHYAYGTALLALSQYDEAAAQMRSEIAISPTSELPFVRLASIALRKEVPSEAIASAERAVELAADSAEAHYLLGKAALQTGGTARAVRELEIACRLAPGSPETHFNLAKAYAKSGQTQRAAEERATFIDLNALAEQQKSQQGNQAYRGPREAGDMSVAPKATANPPN